MKSLWNNFKVAFAMFSKIPMPRADWTKENMKYMFCFFPFIGTVIGGLTMLVAYLGLRFGYQPGFVTAVLVLVPVFVTGGIHVDGLLDTSDALSSWQERSRRLEILKDSHAGAFAVITAAVYFIAWYGAYSQLFNSAENMRAIGILSLGFMVSRCLSGIGVITFPKAKADGTVAEFSRNSSDVLSRNVLIVYLVLRSEERRVGNDLDPACMGKSGFCGSFADFLVLSSYCDEVLWRDNRGYFGILSLYL